MKGAGFGRKRRIAGIWKFVMAGHTSGADERNLSKEQSINARCTSRVTQTSSVAVASASIINQLTSTLQSAR